MVYTSISCLCALSVLCLKFTGESATTPSECQTNLRDVCTVYNKRAGEQVKILM